MKKFTLVLLALLAFAFNVKAQQFVSTEPANRNVILEEFTGRGCGYCTDGHRIANQIMANNPGRVWAINVHAGGYAYTSYPNFNTTPSSTILNGFSVSGFPSGVVNRTTSSAIDRGQWNSQTNTQLNQVAECNVAGLVRVNPDTRLATITVEVYYTGNSSVGENYLTVAMLQDSILGSQADYGNYNPTQWIGTQYVHMHVLRDVITPTWGEAISPTTQGTLITKTYEYQIPESIGNPNGVDVVLDHIFFLAWVSERYQGTPTRPILTACELDMTTMTDEPIYPSISSVSQVVDASCTKTKSFGFDLTNIGTEAFTSIKYNVVVGEVSQEFEWTGNLASGASTKMEFEMEIPFGTYTATLSITEINGQPYEYTTQFAAESLEWASLEVDGDVTNVKVYIVQDQFGEQITWNIVNSAGEIVAEGGPYQHLIGSGSTQVNLVNVTDLPVNECYLFSIFDNNGNGICCNYGQGYYYLKDANGNVFIEGDGDFGSSASHTFSINNPLNVVLTTQDPVVPGYNTAVFTGTLVGEADEVGFLYMKLGERDWIEVPGVLDGDHFTATVYDLESGANYLVKAFVRVGSQIVYGEEVLFHTWYEGVGELEQSLRVYPNPANDYLMVEGQMTSVEVYNTIGQCLLSRAVNETNTRINLSSFDNGIYFLRVNNNGEVVTRKFSVNR